MTHKISILEIQDTMPTCLGYLLLKLGIVDTIYGRIYHSSGNGSVILGAADNLGSSEVNFCNLAYPENGLKYKSQFSHHSCTRAAKSTTSINLQTHKANMCSTL
jgi:hypothetical protein